MIIEEGEMLLEINCNNCFEFDSDSSDWLKLSIRSKRDRTVFIWDSDCVIIEEASSIIVEWSTSVLFNTLSTSFMLLLKSDLFSFEIENWNRTKKSRNHWDNIVLKHQNFIEIFFVLIYPRRKFSLSKNLKLERHSPTTSFRIIKTKCKN